MSQNGTLIASISGIRGIFGDGLDAATLVKYASAYGTWARRRAEETDRAPKIVLGRDARTTGPVCTQIVAATLRTCGLAVVDAGLTPTPTVEMAVLFEEAAGGIVLSASHNPAEWNALKLLNEKSEFLSAEEGEEVLRLAEEGGAETVRHDAVGGFSEKDFLDAHIDAILALDFIDADEIAAANLSVVVDGINSVGAVALPRLLERFGIGNEAGGGERLTVLNAEPTGLFAHPAEPLPAHLTGLTEAVAQGGADLGIAVDPDADRLALVDDTGTYVSEELTQVVCADFLWRRTSGSFATNLSSSRAIEDVAARYDGAEVHRSAVGEINVVKKMQEVGAVLGGEGNGGVILPDLHYGRDALVGVAMVLQHLASEQTTLSQVHADLPRYEIVKDKLPLGDMDAEDLLRQMAERYSGEKISTVDGVKIDFEGGWVHLRPSNTEPILRVYAEDETEAKARERATRFKQELQELA
jgi:phosphomannomutase